MELESEVIKLTALELGRLTGVRVTDPIAFVLGAVLERQAGLRGTGVKVTDGGVILDANVVTSGVLTIDGFIPPKVFGTTTVGRAAGGGGGSGLLTIPTISLILRFVLFPGITRGGG